MNKKATRKYYIQMSRIILTVVSIIIQFQILIIVTFHGIGLQVHTLRLERTDKTQPALSFIGQTIGFL